MNQARLKPKEERRLLRGHLWAYRNEFEELPVLEDGALLDVTAGTGRLIGRGFYQAEGGIAVRILTRRPVPIDAAFFAGRIEAAKRLRDRLYPGASVYRWVYGESDGLPGFVADRYGDTICGATACAFYADHADDLASAFLSYPGIERIRLEVAGGVRRYGADPAPVEVELDGLRFIVDTEGGQKTGLFLDQRENCLAMRRFARGADVLDGHCYVGMWSCHAARAGARRVLGVDTSAKAVEAAENNARSNGLAAQCVFRCADIMEVLRQGMHYDLVLLDPPALAKSRAQLEKALGLYQALNREGMAAVRPGGYLITSCCSQVVDQTAFLEALRRAARAARRKVWVLGTRGAAADHPVLLAMPETAYLTCVFLRIG